MPKKNKGITRVFQLADVKRDMCDRLGYALYSVRYCSYKVQGMVV